MNFQEKVGRNISNIRTTKGYTVEQLSKKTSLSVQKIKRIENGTSDTKLTEIQHIAQALDIEPFCMFFFTEHTSSEAGHSFTEKIEDVLNECDLKTKSLIHTIVQSLSNIGI